MTITIRSRGQSWWMIEAIVRRIIGKGSPQQGTMIPTVGPSPWARGCGSGTVRHQVLPTFDAVRLSVKMLAMKNGHDIHGRCGSALRAAREGKQHTPGGRRAR